MVSGSERNRFIALNSIFFPCIDNYQLRNEKNKFKTETKFVTFNTFERLFHMHNSSGALQTPNLYSSFDFYHQVKFVDQFCANINNYYNFQLSTIFTSNVLFRICFAVSLFRFHLKYKCLLISYDKHNIEIACYINNFEDFFLCAAFFNALEWANYTFLISLSGSKLFVDVKTLNINQFAADKYINTN